MVRIWIGVVLIAGLGWSSGCSDNPAPPPQFNRVLGDQFSGTPLTGDAPDVGILADPASYAGQAGAIDAQAGATAEEAARQLMDQAIGALLNLDIIALLDTVDATRLGPFEDDRVKNALAETFLKLDAVLVTFQRRLQEPELAAWREEYNRVTALLTKSELLQLFRFEAADSDNVSVSIDAAQVIALMDRMAPEGAPLRDQLPGGPDAPLPIDVSDPAAQLEAAPSLLVTRVDGAWKFQPPPTPPDMSSPEELVTGLQFAQMVLTQLNEQLNTIDARTLADPNLAGPAMMSAMGPALFGGMGGMNIGADMTPSGGGMFDMGDMSGGPTDANAPAGGMDDEADWWSEPPQTETDANATSMESDATEDSEQYEPQFKRFDASDVGEDLDAAREERDDRR